MFIRDRSKNLGQTLSRRGGRAAVLQAETNKAAASSPGGNYGDFAALGKNSGCPLI